MKRVIFILTSLLLSVSFLQAQTSSYFGDLKGTKGLGYQGMDIYGNYLVSCQHTGMTTIYDISKGKPEMLS
jgi:hypothetical protein